MKPYHFILATDYSDAVMNAEHYAVTLAKRTGSKISLMHVYELPITLPAEPIAYAQNAEELHTFELQRIEQHANNLYHALHVGMNELEIEPIVREGDPGKLICKEAEDSNADFIVVGTHGVSGFRELFLGSHSWDVIRRASVPVFAIPQDAMFRGIEHIVFGTAYHEDELPVLQFLIDFAKPFGAKITVLHVANPVLTENYAVMKEFEREVFDDFRKKIKERFPSDNMEVHMLNSDAIVNDINKYCLENKVDLLVMAMPKMSFFERVFLANLSLTRKMSFHASLPLLVLPLDLNKKKE